MKLNPDNTRPDTGFIFKHFILDTAQIIAVCGGLQFLNMSVEKQIAVIQWKKPGIFQSVCLNKSRWQGV